MIPDKTAAMALWQKYNLPPVKQHHVTLVGEVAVFFARQLLLHRVVDRIDEPLLLAAALLHDIDKAIPRNPGEIHPDTGVRILREEGMNEVADVVVTHPVHAILTPAIAPSTWEQKILFLSDKMVKNEIMTVNKRFALWRAESLPADTIRMLDVALPYCLLLEKEICSAIDVRPEDIAKRV